MNPAPPPSLRLSFLQYRATQKRFVPSPEVRPAPDRAFAAVVRIEVLHEGHVLDPAVPSAPPILPLEAGAPCPDRDIHSRSSEPATAQTAFAHRIDEGI